MVVLIAGASHTGKTTLAQRMLEAYHWPYLSIDHLKMGLIRSGQTTLTPISDDRELTAYLWPIVCEIIKTAIENRQNLIVEGCYIPFDWEKEFPPAYRAQIRYRCLVMSEHYIREHFAEIRGFANVIEQRLDDGDCRLEQLLTDNATVLAEVQKHNLPYELIDGDYAVSIEEGLQ